jgi:sulfur relay (sulfurtransferase) complex TusBCD TusD component (DsrE family)
MQWHARGMSDAELLEGAQRSTIDALVSAAADADKVLVF